MCFACNRVQPLHKHLTRFGAGSSPDSPANSLCERISLVLKVG
jgi:hypothetical protein